VYAKCGLLHQRKNIIFVNVMIGFEHEILRKIFGPKKDEEGI
jgi:hypothetical protein